jgi:hypothetical protein
VQFAVAAVNGGLEEVQCHKPWVKLTEIVRPDDLPTPKVLVCQEHARMQYARCYRRINSKCHSALVPQNRFRGRKEPPQVCLTCNFPVDHLKEP